MNESYGIFATTRWSVVLAAGSSSSPAAREALERLCQAYWFPLYGYVRAKGFSPHDAEDLTQEFFVRFLASDALRAVSEERGRFRAFLLASLNHFLANEWDRLRAQKRGGGRLPLSFDAVSAEERLQMEPATNLTPERLYEQRWAVTLLGTVLDRLRAEMDAAGKAETFEALRNFLSDTAGTLSYAVAASRLAITEGAARKSVQRLRQRYRELLREEVAHTVGAPHEVEEELAALMATLSLFKSTPSAGWLIVPVVAAPTILLLFAVALWFPALRPGVGSFGVNCAIWGSVLLLSALPWLRLVRQAQMDVARQETLKLQQAAKDQIRRERFARLTSHSPLADWLEFAAWGSDVRDEALAGIRQLSRRQSDAEAMLANGEGVILEMLPLLDLQSTPALCLHARRFLCNYIETLAGPEENSSSLPLAVHRLERFDRALEWFCRRHGDIFPVFDCIEGFARKHPDTPERSTFLAQLENRRKLCQ